MSTQWTGQQQAIFQWFASGTGNLVVRARAGTGKTTTILEGIGRAPEQRILLCAFNKRIAKELEERLRNPAAEARTLHSVGFGLVKRYWENIRIDSKGERAEHLARLVCGEGAPDRMVRLVARLHTKGREMAPLAKDYGDLHGLAYEFDCVPDADWAAEGFDLNWVERHALQAMELAATERPIRTGIDFADMLYLPVRNRWLRPRYDLVVVDECQDMNATQLLIAQGVTRGRMAVVGDDRQAVYGFRGADSESLDRLKHELQAMELGLATTYRCGQNIVTVAQRLVPDYQAASQNPPGTIGQLSMDSLPTMAQVGDFVLSRKNAPLVSIALRILRTGTRCKIEGRDIGAGLRALIRQLATGAAGKSMPEFLGRLTRWEEREVERADRAGDKGAEARIERIQDQADMLRALAEGLSGVRELQTRIDNLFADANGQPRVICSSIHRAKGLEADRVFVLRDTLYPSVPCACGHWAREHGKTGCDRCRCRQYSKDAKRQLEEQNLEYVAITRAKSRLVWVNGPANAKG